jgi:protein O-GlcNAc transferase
MLEALKLVYAGAQYLDRGERDSAEKTWRRAVELDPKCSTAWTYLTDFLAVADRTTEALLCLDRLIACSEKSAGNLFVFADKSSYLKQYDRARRYLEEAVAADPTLALRANRMRATMLYNEGLWERAFEATEAVLTEEPGDVDAREVRLACLHHMSRIWDEVENCRIALAIAPNAKIHNRLVFKLNYLPESTPEIVYEESRRWNDRYAVPLANEIYPHRNDPDPERRLKIGYVSPDFRSHAIMKLLPGVFENHDESFEIFAYSIDTQEDPFTDFVRGSVDHFRELPSEMNAIVEQIRADEIDILVDLAGRTMPQQAFLAFAMKPAPIQVSWMGVMATTGLDTMDYFIGDPELPCPGTEHLFSEKVYRLTRIAGCFRPRAELPIERSPYFENGYITFGCFIETRRITRQTVQLWSVLMRLHPSSKLLLKYAGMELPATQDRFRQWFSEDGVSPDRIDFEGRSIAEYMRTWNKVDIALDPFPYNGGTTSMDALWMGVPLVTMSGRLAVSCAGASILSAVGLPFARNAEEYLALANSLVEAVQKTPGFRERIREAMIHSPLMDEPALMLEVEAAYRQMWRAWCAQQAEYIPG